MQTLVHQDFVTARVPTAVRLGVTELAHARRTSASAIVREACAEKIAREWSIVRDAEARVVPSA